MAISCPLCCQSISVDLLRTTLISVMNRPLICSICGDVQHSLDNLATHLTHHIDMLSQIGHQTKLQPNDVNNVIQNINKTTTTTTIANSNESDQNKLDQSICDGNIAQQLEMSLHSSPPPASLHELNLSEQPIMTATSPNDRLVQPFLCNLCECSFRSQDLQEMHMELVHEICIRPSHEDSKLINSHVISASMLQCSLCPKRFKMIGSLRLHVRMVHGVLHVPEIQSTINVQKPTTSVLTNNLVGTMTGNEHKMETGDSIATTSSLHVNSVDQPLVQNNQSDYLGNYSHNDSNFGTSISNNSVNDDSSSGGGGGSLTTSQQKLIDEPCNGNNNSKETSIVIEDRVHKCDICNKRFTTKYLLKKHKQLHTGEMPYTCELFHRTFTFQQSYHRHLSYHTNDRPHSCSICGRAFKELSTLHNHQRIHSGEKPFECETCGKCFRQRVSYLVHRRIHTGVMPYNCMTCDKKFRYKISLRTHKCTGFIGNERTETTTVNNDVVTFNDNDQHSMSSCQETIDELITESCNRMGIVDRIDSNLNSSESSFANTQNSQQSNNSAMLEFECDSFNLNDLAFCTNETTHTDLANVVPSMNEIFPQSIEILNALYDNASGNTNDLHHFYDSSPSQQ